ncbi:MAG: hypothetical protein F2797_02305 [Actinobacteria bacterium]|uniref:Unannotated protein n=1 Tax=freshwater metagenome TaxID=449393 RepID=A0A6J6Q654_9ZZZZ|nr:hypothetical protein [Actinomycetota bacterium]MSY17066.1 hypothetical protein [Actinomycetota bacterium]
MTKREGWIAGLVVAAVLLAAAGVWVVAKPASESSAGESWLFSQSADGGYLSKNTDGSYTLALTGVDANTLAFTDRPVRSAKVLSTTSVVNSWNDSFGGDAPNAVLVELNPAGAEDSVVMTLGNPTMKGNVVSYPATILADEAISETLNGVVGSQRSTPPLKFNSASLFIDGASSLPTNDWPSNVLVAPYVDAGGWPVPDFVGMGTATGLKNFSAGFITQSAPCVPQWGGANQPVTGGTLAAAITAFQSVGGRVIPSIGGQSAPEGGPADLSANCTDVVKLQAAFEQIVSGLNLDRLDFDIEASGGIVYNQANSQRRAAAVAALQKAHPELQISLTLGTLPDGLPQAAVSVVNDFVNAGVKNLSLNAMAMWFGSNEPDMGATVFASQQATKGQFPNLPVGVTPALGAQGSGENFTTANACALGASIAKAGNVSSLGWWKVGPQAPDADPVYAYVSNFQAGLSGNPCPTSPPGPPQPTPPPAGTVGVDIARSSGTTTISVNGSSVPYPMTVVLSPWSSTVTWVGQDSGCAQPGCLVVANGKLTLTTSDAAVAFGESGTSTPTTCTYTRSDGTTAPCSIGAVTGSAPLAPSRSASASAAPSTSTAPSSAPSTAAPASTAPASTAPAPASSAPASAVPSPSAS